METFPPKRIVVATNLSPASLTALETAKALALRWGSSLEVVRVEESAPEEAAESLMSRRVSRALTGFPAERVLLRTLQGWPVREMLARAATDTDILVMGTHRADGLKRALRGSLAEVVIGASRVPVMAIHAFEPALKISRVLAPWNGRPYATRALCYARALARSLNTELRVLRVVPAGQSIEECALGLRRRLESMLGSGDSPAWSLRVRVGDEREHIIQEANSGRYGLVVLSAHRRPYSLDAVSGSTVERLLRASKTPVVACPAERPLPAR